MSIGIGNDLHVGRRIGVWLSGGGSPGVATYTVTTTGAGQTHTIQSLAVSASTVVDWGDGSDNTYTGSGTRTHVYASAGTYTVTIATPELVTTFDMRDSKVTLNSADIARMVNVQTFIATAIGGGRFDSADVVNWRPTTFGLYSMPAGYAGTFDSVDVSEWRPTTFQLYSMPAATFAIAVNGGFRNWTTGLNNFQMQGNGLLQAVVDAILWELYQAALTRTATGGTINVGGTNAAPSGTYQAAAACPVTVDTDGKEVAHELINDGCGAITNHWSTVTITA